MVALSSADSRPRVQFDGDAAYCDAWRAPSPCSREPRHGRAIDAARARTFANSRSRCAPLVRGRGFNPRGRRRRRRASAPPANIALLLRMAACGTARQRSRRWAARATDAADASRGVAPTRPTLPRAPAHAAATCASARCVVDCELVGNQLAISSALIAGNLGNKYIFFNGWPLAVTLLVLLALLPPLCTPSCTRC